MTNQKNMMKLDKQNLEAVNGGYIFNDHVRHNWLIIDDKSGKTLRVRPEHQWSKSRAASVAESLGQSGKEIDYAMVKALRDACAYATPVGN